MFCSLVASMRAKTARDKALDYMQTSLTYGESDDLQVN